MGSTDHDPSFGEEEPLAMNDPKHPLPGERHIDVTDISLVDITSDYVSHLSKLREGHAAAVANLMQAGPAARKKAGLNEDEVEELAAAWAACMRVDEVLPAVEKLLELLVETRLVRGHEVAVRIGEMAHQIRRRAERSPNGGEILGPFQTLVDYHFAVGQKAAAAREKKKKEAEQAVNEVPASQG